MPDVGCLFLSYTINQTPDNPLGPIDGKLAFAISVFDIHDPRPPGDDGRGGGSASGAQPATPRPELYGLLPLFRQR